MRKYEQVVSHIRRRIEAGTLKLDDQLPSVRALSALTGFSMVTVHHAYALLESEGIIRARPRAGFFVAQPPRPLGSFSEAPATEETSRRGVPVPVDSLNFRVLTSWHKKDLEAFGAIYPSSDIFPRRRLSQALRKVLLRDPDRAAETGRAGGRPLAAGDHCQAHGQPRDRRAAAGCADHRGWPAGDRYLRRCADETRRYGAGRDTDVFSRCWMRSAAATCWRWRSIRTRRPGSTLTSSATC